MFSSTSDVTPTSNSPQVFAFGDHEIRVIRDGADKVLFAAIDVCAALEIKNVAQALRKMPAEHKGIYPIYTLGGEQRIAFVNEPGLYRLIFRSDKPEAEKFRKWVFEEVLPMIRKQGYYALPEVAEKIEFALRRQEKLSYSFIREMVTLATDYRQDEQRTRWIFRDVQNKIHFAATGLTAGELVLRANRHHESLGLTNWKGASPIKADVVIGKNYLTARELQDEEDLDRLLTVMLSEIRKNIERGRTTVTMYDIERAVDKTIETARYDVLVRSGHVDPVLARKRAEREYEVWKQRRLITEGSHEAH